MSPYSVHKLCLYWKSLFPSTERSSSISTRKSRVQHFMIFKEKLSSTLSLNILSIFLNHLYKTCNLEFIQIQVISFFIHFQNILSKWDFFNPRLLKPGHERLCIFLQWEHSIRAYLSVRQCLSSSNVHFRQTTYPIQSFTLKSFVNFFLRQGSRLFVRFM